MAKITYGTHELDSANFHPNSIDAMIRRGVAHFLGNETASKVNSWADSDEGVKVLDGLDEASAKAIKDARKLEHQKEGIQALLDGTIGTSVRGPRADPMQAAMNTIAKARIVVNLKAAGLKTPVGDKTVNLGGTEYTMGQLVERQLTKFGEEIKKEASKIVAANERKLAQAKDAASKRGNVQVASPDDLGL